MRHLHMHKSAALARDADDCDAICLPACVREVVLAHGECAWQRVRDAGLIAKKELHGWVESEQGYGESVEEKRRGRSFFRNVRTREAQEEDGREEGRAVSEGSAKRLKASAPLQLPPRLQVVC